MLVLGTQLQNLAIEGGRLCEGDLVAQRIRGRDKLLDGFVEFAGANEEIAKDVRGISVVRGVLDDAEVIGDCLIELPLPEELLGETQRGGAIEGHDAGISPMSRTASAAGTTADAPPSTEPRNRVQMVGCRISLVSVEAVPRISAVENRHLPIADHFCHN